jgi:hypothetical protein
VAFCGRDREKYVFSIFSEMEVLDACLIGEKIEVKGD